MLFDVQRRERQGWTVIAVIGDLDLSSAPRVRHVVQQVAPYSAAVAGGPPRVVVDLTATDFVDSAGLGVVLGVVRRVLQAGGRAAVALHPASPVAAVFAVLHLDRVVAVASDVDEVLARDEAGTLAPMVPAGGRDG